jgi:hypothetical protein
VTLEAPYASRPAEAADAPFLLAVYAASRAAEIDAVPWSPAQREAFVALQFEAQRRYYAERFPDSTHLVLLAQGAPAGRLWANVGPDEVRILDLSLLSGADAGVAARALAGLVEASAARQLPIRVHLDAADPLLSQYLDLGFCEAKSGGTTPLYECMPSTPNP